MSRTFPAANPDTIRETKIFIGVCGSLAMIIFVLVITANILPEAPTASNTARLEAGQSIVLASDDSGRKAVLTFEGTKVTTSSEQPIDGNVNEDITISEPLPEYTFTLREDGAVEVRWERGWSPAE